MYDELLRKGLLKREAVSRAEVMAALSRARRDLSTAGDLPVTYFNRVRVKRHTAVYDVAGLVTQRESADVLSRAARLVDIIEDELS